MAGQAPHRYLHSVRRHFGKARRSRPLFSRALARPTHRGTHGRRYGRRLPVTEPTGSMVVDIGGGTTEVALFPRRHVTSSSLRLAGNKMDEAIAMYLRDARHQDRAMAEIIKIKIGSILPFEDGREKDMIISGQDVYTEQPKEVTIQSRTRAALQPPIEEMVLHIKDTFKKTTPDLASDIIPTASCSRAAAACSRASTAILRRAFRDSRLTSSGATNDQLRVGL